MLLKMITREELDVIVEEVKKDFKDSMENKYINDLETEDEINNAFELCENRIKNFDDNTQGKIKYFLWKQIKELVKKRSIEKKII